MILGRRKNRLAGDERGLAAVEFAILFLPLCICLMGLLDAGYFMYVRSLLQGALNDVARMATVEDPEIGEQGTVEQQIDASIRKKMGRLVKTGSYVIDQKSYAEFGRIGKPEKQVEDDNGNGKIDPGDCWEDTVVNGTHDKDQGKTGVGGADDIVVYKVTLTTPRLLPMNKLIGLPGMQKVTATTTVRNQPFANQKAPAWACL